MFIHKLRYFMLILFSFSLLLSCGGGGSASVSDSQAKDLTINLVFADGFSKQGRTDEVYPFFSNITFMIVPLDPTEESNIVDVPISATTASPGYNTSTGELKLGSYRFYVGKSYIIKFMAYDAYYRASFVGSSKIDVTSSTPNPSLNVYQYVIDAYTVPSVGFSDYLGENPSYFYLDLLDQSASNNQKVNSFVVRTSGSVNPDITTTISADSSYSIESDVDLNEKTFEAAVTSGPVYYEMNFGTEEPDLEFRLFFTNPKGQPDVVIQESGYLQHPVGSLIGSSILAKNAISYPKGGETLLTGENITVTWLPGSIKGATVSIYLIPNGDDLNQDSSNIPLMFNSLFDMGGTETISAEAMNTGSYTFENTYDEGANYKILIVSNDDRNSYDISDSVFSISELTSAVVSAVKKTGVSTSYMYYDDGYHQYGLTPEFTRDSVYNLITDTVTSNIWMDSDIYAATYTDALNACESLSVSGYSDWDVPTAAELTGIYNYGTHGLPDYFENLDTNYILWTSTDDSTGIAKLAMEQGTGLISSASNLSGSFGVICITRTPNTPMLMKANGIVTDSINKLSWQDSAFVAYMPKPSDAVIYCNNLTLDGHTDWRLPNINELRSIVDYGSANGMDSVFDYVADKYWSSTAYSHAENYYGINFKEKTDFIGFAPVSGISVRCVRSDR